MKSKTTTYSIQGKSSHRCNILWGACSACVVARRLLLSLLLVVFLTPLTALFTACVYDNDELLPPEEYLVEESDNSYVELRIAVPHPNSYGTRANPMGGEEGNGRENAILKEDIIHNINIFFYVGSNGLDSPDETTVKKHFYYNLDNNSDPKNTKLWFDDESINGNEVDEDGNPKNYPYYKSGYYIIKLQCSEDEINLIKENDGLDFVAIANLGPIEVKSNLTLGELRDASFLDNYEGRSWTSFADADSQNAKDMDYFLMSTAYNKNYTYGTDRQPTGNNKIEINGNKYIGTTTLQRLCARLDLWYNKDRNATIKTQTNAGQEVSYVDELHYQVVKAENHTVFVTNVIPVNVMQSPSYLFKKVTNGLSSFTFDEINNWNYFSWGGKEDPDGIPTSNPDIPLNYVMERHTTDKLVGGQTPETTLYEWFGTTNTKQAKIDIASESNGQFSNYYDGVQLRGEYDDDYGCDHISIIGYANENTHSIDCFHSNYLTGMAFRAVYVPSKIYTAYSKPDEGDASTGLTELTGDLSEDARIYRYSPTGSTVSESESLYFTNEADAKAYANDHRGDMAIISKGYDAVKHDGKWGFICYYNLWLRHYNDENADPQTAYPMEYAIVRNNIYRVALEFSGPGDPTPTMREPETMQARIFVRKWNQRNETKPLEF